jgi:hypothetical protein
VASAWLGPVAWSETSRDLCGNAALLDDLVAALLVDHLLRIRLFVPVQGEEAGGVLADLGVLRKTEQDDAGAARVCALADEGQLRVAKRWRSCYRPGERGWVKVKNRSYWRYELERGAAIKRKRRTAALVPGEAASTSSGTSNPESSLRTHGAYPGAYLGDRNTSICRVGSAPAGGILIIAQSCRQARRVPPPPCVSAANGECGSIGAPSS